MKTKLKQFLLAMAVLAALVILPSAVKADPIVLTLDPTQSVAAGSSVSFMGTFSNGGSPGRFVNNVSFTLVGSPSGFTFDPAAFFAAVPQFVASGFSVGPTNFFSVLVSAAVAPGLYTGSFSVLGGDDDDDETTLATQEFTINVTQGGPAPIPEPATMLLLGSGLIGAAAARRRKQRQMRTP